MRRSDQSPAPKRPTTMTTVKNLLRMQRAISFSIIEAALPGWVYRATAPVGPPSLPAQRRARDRQGLPPFAGERHADEHSGLEQPHWIGDHDPRFDRASLFGQRRID